MYPLYNFSEEAKAERNNLTVLDILEKWAAVQPNVNFLSQKEQKLTYRETVNETNRLGRTFHNELGVQYGTKYSLFMNNRIEYVTDWFGGVRAV